MEMSGFSSYKIKTVNDLFACRVFSVTLLISSDQEKFSGYFLPQLGPKLTKTKSLPSYLRRRNILEAQTLEEAIKGCDTYVAKQVLKGKLSRG